MFSNIAFFSLQIFKYAFYLCRMITERAHGVKRKLSEVDGDGEVLHGRCIQRQTVFNISICKLQKSFTRSEPILCRTVLISNTLRLIEEDIREERKTLEMTVVSELSDGQTRAVNDNSERLAYVGHNIGTRSREECETLKRSLTFEQEMNILGDKMVKELEFDLEKSANSAQKIPAKAKSGPEGQQLSFAPDSNNNSSLLSDDNDQHHGKEVSYNAEEFIREITCGSLLGMELTEELEFKDVDVSLYDFDVPNGSFPIDFDEFCTAWNLGSTSVATKSLSSRCSDSIKLERANDYAFDELDQVMQILVGS